MHHDINNDDADADDDSSSNNKNKNKNNFLAISGHFDTLGKY